jgi:hypothetical protein
MAKSAPTNTNVLYHRAVITNAALDQMITAQNKLTNKIVVFPDT